MMTTAQEPFAGATHKATVGDVSVYFDGSASFEDACGEAIKLAGGGVPRVSRVTGANGKSVVLPDAAPEVERGEGHVDVAGKLRSMADVAALTEAGFAPAQPYYERGTRVVELGVENARKAREEFEAMPTVDEYVSDFVDRIDGEERGTTDHELAALRMSNDGELVMPVQTSSTTAEVARLPLNQRSFGSLVSRMGIGGIRYLSEQCWPRLRAINVNNQLKRIGEEETVRLAEWTDRVQMMCGVSQRRAEKEAGPHPEQSQVRLLTRNNHRHPSGREVYGVVSPQYQAGFGADKVAEALSRAMPGDARGEVSYDGRRARFRVLFHSTVRPEDYVAGEVFRVGIGVRTDDTGGGACVVEGMFWQNLCLNLICIDEGVTGIARIRHVGSVSVLAKKFEKSMEQAKAAVSHFLDAWSYGTRELVLERTASVTADTEDRKLIEDVAGGALPVSQVLPGLFNGIIERELVPVRGRRSETIPKLLRMYDKDESAARFAADGKTERPLSRTAIVNAFTRYAHQGQNDPWQQDEIQAAAGQLLFGKKLRGEGGRSARWAEPEPLPYVPLV